MTHMNASLSLTCRGFMRTDRQRYLITAVEEVFPALCDTRQETSSSTRTRPDTDFFCAFTSAAQNSHGKDSIKAIYQEEGLFRVRSYKIRL